MNLTTRCPHCGNPRQRHHHESPWCDGCLRSLFDRLDRLEAIAAAQDTPSSPANAPEVPQGQTGDSDGTERIRVTKENSHPDAPRWREHSILLNSISWRISEALGQVGPGDTEHQVDLESNITEVLTALAALAALKARRCDGCVRWGAVYVSGPYAGMASCDGQPVDDCGCGAMPMTAPDHACNAWEARSDG